MMRHYRVSRLFLILLFFGELVVFTSKLTYSIFPSLWLYRLVAFVLGGGRYSVDETLALYPVHMWYAEYSNRPVNYINWFGCIVSIAVNIMILRSSLTTLQLRLHMIVSSVALILISNCDFYNSDLKANAAFILTVLIVSKLIIGGNYSLTLSRSTEA
jgi:hypothetical protein